MLDRLQGHRTDVLEGAVDVQVSRLRRKLQGWSRDEVIRTVRSAGYLLDATVLRG